MSFWGLIYVNIGEGGERILGWESGELERREFVDTKTLCSFQDKSNLTLFGLSPDKKYEINDFAVKVLIKKNTLESSGVWKSET